MAIVRLFGWAGEVIGCSSAGISWHKETRLRRRNVAEFRARARPSQDSRGLSDLFWEPVGNGILPLDYCSKVPRREAVARERGRDRFFVKWLCDVRQNHDRTWENEGAAVCTRSATDGASRFGIDRIESGSRGAFPRVSGIDGRSFDASARICARSLAGSGKQVGGASVKLLWGKKRGATVRN